MTNHASGSTEKISGVRLAEITAGYGADVLLSEAVQMASEIQWLREQQPSEPTAPQALVCALKHADSIDGDSTDALALRLLAEEVRRLSGEPPAVNTNSVSISSKSAPPSEPRQRCGWWGEGRGQCLLWEGHKDEHTCECDGRQLRVAMQGLAAVRETERRQQSEPEAVPLAVAGKLTVAIERGGYVLAQMMQAYERRIRSDCTTQEQIYKRPWECAEYLAAASYLRTMFPQEQPPTKVEPS